MRTRLALALLATSLACAGRIDSTAADGGAHLHGDAAESHDATAPGRDTAAPTDAGTDCGQPPQVEYMCPKSAEAGLAECHRYGGADDVAPADASFAQGCTVTLTTCDTSFGGAQTCNCQLFPVGDAGPEWVCPI